MDEKEAKENLEIIRTMIEETKRGVVYSGHIYIFWGILTLLAVVTTYALAISHLFRYIGLTWLVLMSAGFVYSIYHGVTQSRKAKITSFSDQAIHYTWFGCGVTLMILGFVAPLAGVFPGQAVPPVGAVVIGSAYFVTGKLYHWRLLVWESLLWWATGAAMMFMKTETTLLVFAALIVAGYLVPGFVLRANYHRQLTR